ncbi:ThiF family adenylyltransferase (plasmid) [Entomospira entomophila]|uniref:ThiF family adenylyltransferase n=1 Tax=Entomospira entomophila TaxID=2719988 RepID=A0A968GBA3_9SPIO|nr:ThiF family adenylyltransferase [Entomospira entomophilus]NIZ41377.1 ThiF family adenylyltransferase [Entomospira entomophilus]WDI36212.1 ThiF family adenylyltransferase [Entomospira entomophilus]
MFYTKNPTAFFSETNSDRFINLGKYQFTPEQKDFIRLLHLAIFTTDQKSEKEIYDFLENQEIPHSTWNLALDYKLIIPVYKPRNKGFYPKNKLFLDLLLRNPQNFNLDQEHILVIGCGGIGNFMTYPLTTLGIGTMSLLDGDHVEESNLNRQFLFDYHSIGRSKVEVMAEKLHSMNNKMEIRTYPHELSMELLKNIYHQSNQKISLVILSADEGNCLEITNTFCTANKIALLNVGYLNDFSVIGPFYIPDLSACYYCEDSLGVTKQSNSTLQKKIKEAHKNHQAPSFFTNNAIASSMAIIDILYFFNQSFDQINSLNKRIGISNHDFSFHSIPVTKNDTCKYCGNSLS